MLILQDSLHSRDLASNSPKTISAQMSLNQAV